MQGDIVAVYNNSGSRVATYEYDAWGNYNFAYTNLSSNPYVQYNPFLYRGYYYDYDLKLYRTGTRYYDAVIGRFVNPDDVSYLGSNEKLDSYNLYAYCSNNPAIYSDPSGNSMIGILASGFAFGAFVGGVVNLTSQLIENGFDVSTVDWRTVGSDALFGGLNGLLASSGCGVWSSSFVGMALSATQTVVNSKIIGKDVDNTELLVSSALGFASGFIPKAGINAKEVSSKLQTFNYNINNAIKGLGRHSMYTLKKSELLTDVITSAGVYALSCVTSEVISRGLLYQ